MAVTSWQSRHDSHVIWHSNLEDLAPSAAFLLSSSRQWLPGPWTSLPAGGLHVKCFALPSKCAPVYRSERVSICLHFVCTTQASNLEIRNAIDSTQAELDRLQAAKRDAEAEAAARAAAEAEAGKNHGC